MRLYRENTIKQALSHIVANALFAASGNYNIPAGASTKGVRREKILVDPHSLLRTVEEYQKAEMIVDRMLDKHAIGEVMSVSYESIASAANGIAPVYAYFVLPYHEHNAAHVKVNGTDLSRNSFGTPILHDVFARFAAGCL